MSIIEKEIFKSIELRGATYKVSNHGRIFGKRKELKQRLNEDGYCVVTVGTSNNRSLAFVARVVGMMFVPGYEKGKEINHKDFNRANNYYKNLEWVTHQDNISYTIKNNYQCFCDGKKGSKNGRAVYTEAQVRWIRSKASEGCTTMEIVKMLYPNLNYRERKKKWGTINRIMKYETWK